VRRDRRVEPSAGAGCPDVAAALEVSPAELAATGGEDYELLFTIAPDRVAGLEEDVTWIGRVADGVGRRGLDRRRFERLARLRALTCSRNGAQLAISDL
jgi:thiamine monophosphate kinase